MIQLPSCPACGSAARREFDLGAGHHLRRCERCETVSASEYGDPREIYVQGYLFGEVAPFGNDVRAPLFQEYLRCVAGRRLAMVEAACGIRGGRLLDVGSGTGEVLLAAQARGWRAHGVEPERSAAEMARGRGLDVEVAELEQSGLPERAFDVVSAFHVLEHMPDSRAFLKTLARWARPGGCVCIEVPNFASVQRRRLREAWNDLRPREHLVHFTPRTLAETFRGAGIEPITVRSPVYVGPPQSLDQALWDLVRPHGRLRRLLVRLSRPSARTGAAPAVSAPAADSDTELYPTRAGWALLHAVEAVYDATGVGTVVVCVGRVR
jgi:SAM-dependent methyltransferase